MKKRQVLLVVLFFGLLLACPQMSKHSCKEVRYDTMSREMSESIIIKQDEKVSFKPIVIHLINEEEISKKIYRRRDFADLQDIVFRVNLDSLDKLNIPSTKYEYDGAKLAQIKIHFNTKIYTSIPFDDDNPPKELLELITYLKKAL